MSVGEWEERAERKRRFWGEVRRVVCQVETAERERSRDGGREMVGSLGFSSWEEQCGEEVVVGSAEFCGG